MRICLAAIAILLAFGCTKKVERKGYHSRTMATVTAGVELPVSLWSKLEEVPGPPKDAAAKEEMTPTDFIGLKVYLTEKNPGILGGENHELIYGDGGGELDLADFAQPKSGSFYFAVEPVLEIKNDDKSAPPKVFYLSNAVKRKLNLEYVGAGCNTYHDVTSLMLEAAKSNGILVNTTAGRHVSTLAGTYFFAIPQAGHLYLAHLTVKDSRFRSLHCRR
jgi:hypothetical protein